MKVIFLIDSLEGYGAEKSVVQIALNMKEVVPVFVHFYDAEGLKSSLVEAGIMVYSLHTKGFNKTVELLSSIIQKERPNILHSTLFRSDMIARRLKKKYPNLLLVGSFVSNSYGSKRYSALSFLSKAKLFSTQIRDRISSGTVDYFICNSNAIMTTNKRALGIPEKKIFVIYRGRSFTDFTPSTDAVENLRKELNLDSDKIFLNVSRLVKSKGQLDLLKSFQLLLQRHPNNKLYIVGEGPLREELAATILELELDKKVFMLGYREDVSELLAISDYFVFSSYFEGLPGALVEAVIAKKPCIVSNIPENRECFPEKGAIFFPPGNTEHLALKMEEALKVEDWDERVEYAFAYASKNFQIKKISQKYEEFYKRIILEKKASNKFPDSSSTSY